MSDEMLMEVANSSKGRGCGSGHGNHTAASSKCMLSRHISNRREPNTYNRRDKRRFDKNF